jgi:ferrous iron transport protein A
MIIDCDYSCEVDALVMSERRRPTAVDLTGETTLADGRRGFCGVILAVSGQADARRSLEPDELERRLLEIGFVEGARVEILHEGAFGRDPIVVRLDDARIALRRREARAVIVRPGQTR